MEYPPFNRLILLETASYSSTAVKQADIIRYSYSSTAVEQADIIRYSYSSTAVGFKSWVI